MAGDTQVPFHAPPPNADGGDEIVVSRSRTKVTVLIVFASLLTIEGAILALRPQPTWPGAVRVDGAFVAIIAGAVVVAGLRAIFTSSSVVVVNQTGIYLRSKLFGGGIITWQEITELIPYRSGLQTCLRIVFSDPQLIAAHQTALQRLGYRMLKGNPITTKSLVTADGTWNLTVTELLTQIEARFEGELKHNHIHIRQLSHRGT